MAATASFKQQCPSCEAWVPIRDPNLIGRKIDCPKCKYRFVVEDPGSTAEDEEAAETAAENEPGKADREERCQGRGRREESGGQRQSRSAPARRGRRRRRQAQSRQGRFYQTDSGNRAGCRRGPHLRWGRRLYDHQQRETEALRGRLSTSGAPAGTGGYCDAGGGTG